jgi:hypothetical protein
LAVNDVKSQKTDDDKGAEIKINITKLDNKNDSLPNVSTLRKKEVPKRSLTEKLVKDDIKMARKMSKVVDRQKLLEMNNMIEIDNQEQVENDGKMML